MKEFNQFKKVWTVAPETSVDEIVPTDKVMNQFITMFSPVGFTNIKVYIAGIDMADVGDYLHLTSGVGAILHIPFPVFSDVHVRIYNPGRTDSITVTLMGGNA